MLRKSPLLILLLFFLFAELAAAIEIPLRKQAGVYTLPVRINGVITLNFILDTGASEVTIPTGIALSLLKTGTINEKDFLPGHRYRMADGSILNGSRFRIRELEVGGVKMYDVAAAVVAGTGPLLLGQSFLSRAGHWTIDNEKQILVISDLKMGDAPPRQEELNPEIKNSNVWPNTFPGKANDSQAASQSKIPPSREVDRSPDGKIPPTR